jgi:hypothetical protein
MQSAIVAIQPLTVGDRYQAWEQSVYDSMNVIGEATGVWRSSERLRPVQPPQHSLPIEIHP